MKVVCSRILLGRYPVINTCYGFFIVSLELQGYVILSFFIAGLSFGKECIIWLVSLQYRDIKMTHCPSTGANEVIITDNNHVRLDRIKLCG